MVQIPRIYFLKKKMVSERGQGITRTGKLSTKKQNIVGNTKSYNRLNYERTHGVSPIFNFTNSAEISTTESLLFDFYQDTPETEKYGAFDSISITNNSNSTLLMYPNQQRDRAISIPANTIITFDRKTIPALRSVEFNNSDTSNAVAINELRFEIWKEGIVVDNVLKNIHKSIFRAIFNTNQGVL